LSQHSLRLRLFGRVSTSPAVMLSVAIVACGCGPRPPATAPVSGIVMIDDTPLPAGMVHFVPDESRGTRGRMAVAWIGADGRFANATSLRPGDGAPIGFHRIEIVVPQGPQFAGDDPTLSSAPTSSPLTIPERYADVRTSGLTAEVVAGQQNEFEFRLTRRKKK
jgi:hypothetical protein